MKKISILIPAYNEQEVINTLYDRLNKVIDPIVNYNFEILFVNDGSKDDTLNIIKRYRENDKRISYVSLSRNYGKEIAMAAGFDYTTGDAVIIMDADLQDPPELIPKMIQYWEKGYDDVYAKRISRKGETWFKKWSSKTFYSILQKLTNIQIQKDTGDFRLLDRRCVEAIKKMRETQRYTKGIFSWIGYNKKEILFHRDPRLAGKTKWNYKKLFDLAVEGITSFTIAPLRIASFAGLFTVFSVVLYMLYVLINLIIFKQVVNEYTFVFILLFLLGGIQLTCLGVIGEYLGRIFNETKRRPLYLIDGYNGEKGKNIGINYEDE